jgi:polyferredoxin
MAKPTFFDYPTFRETKIPAVRLAHWKPVTTYTKYRWLVQALIVIAFVLAPYMRWLKLDFTNDRYWLLGYEVSMVIALQAVVILWLGTYFVNFFENYLIGRLLCGWICPWGLLNRLGMIINHVLRRHKRRRLIAATANLLFSTAATLVVMNWMIDLGTLFKPQHPYFGIAWGGLVILVLIGFVILHKLGFKFCETLCPFGMYLTVVTQKNSLRISFDSSRACVDCGLCTQVCPMDLSPREMDFKDPMNGGFGQCILCGDCIDICKIRMGLEGLPPPLRWNTGKAIIPLLPLEPAVRIKSEVQG